MASGIELLVDLGISFAYFSPMVVNNSQTWSAISFEFDIFLLFIMNVWGMLVLSLVLLIMLFIVFHVFFMSFFVFIE